MSHRKRKIRENMLFLLTFSQKNWREGYLAVYVFIGVCQIIKFMAKNLAKPIKQTSLENC